MKLLVTGGLGFIGSNFILNVLLKFPRTKIINLDAGLIGSNQKSLIEIKSKKNYLYVKGNILNKNLIEKLVRKSDTIVNFAAETHVDRSISNSRPFLKSNFDGVYVILEAIKKFKKKFVQISTDEVYGSLKTESANEKFPLNPSNPYSASKGAAELLIQSYFTTFNCNVNITRCTNNYGPRQALEKLIPKTIILAEKNRKIPVYGTGKNIRDWIYVDDHCKAILKVILDGKKGESYNIAASNEINNTIIVKKILKIMNKSIELIEYTKDRPGHDFRYSLDSTKIFKELKWKPRHNFDKHLEETIMWYRTNRNWWKNSFPKILGTYK